MNNALTQLAAAQTGENLLTLVEAAEKAKGMTEEELAGSFVSSESLKRVEVHVSKGFIRVDFGKIINLNLDGLSETERKFGAKTGSNYTFTAFQDQIKKLISIETSIRNYRDNYAVGKSVYMNIDTLQNEFFPKFKEKEEKFQEVVEEIKSVYDEEIKSFKMNVRNLAFKLCPDQFGQIEKDLVYQTRLSADAFCGKFNMALSTDFKVSQLSDEKLREVVWDSNKAFIKKQFSDFQNGMIQELFKATCVYYKGVAACISENLSSMGKTRNNLRNAAVKVKRDNVGDLPLITTITDSMMKLAEIETRMEGMENAYDILTVLYGKASDLEFPLDVSFLPAGDFGIRPQDLLNEYRDMLMC